MNFLGRKSKREVREAVQSAMEQRAGSHEGLKAAKELNEQANVLAAILGASRRENHYAPRMRLAYEVERREIRRNKDND